MSKPLSFATEIERALMTLQDASKGLDAAERILADHAANDAKVDAVNFPLEEELVGEAVGLLRRWNAEVIAVLKRLDAATAAAAVHFERLFDGHAGRENSGLLGKRIGAARPHPAAIAVELKGLLSASASLDIMLKGLKPAVQSRYRSAEMHLLRIIERRQRIDFEIEESQRRTDALTPKIEDRLQRMKAARSPASIAAYADERKALIAERDACLIRERGLQPERKTLQTLIAIYEDFVDTLNTEIAVVNVMGGKLAVDSERQVALLKAVSSRADLPMGDLQEATAALIAAFDANPLSGYGLEQRKVRADEAFARRLDAPPAPPVEDAVAEAENEVISQP